MTQSTPLLALLSGVTADITGNAQLYTGNTQLAALYINGSLGGGAVTLQAKPRTNSTYAAGQEPNIDFTPVSGATALVNSEVKLVSIPTNCELRAILSGSSGASGVSVALHYQ